MQLLEERIRKDGVVREGNVLKVDSFLNHQIDVSLFQEIGREFLRRYDACSINKILTIEASGIGIACITAQYFQVPVVFAKKNKTSNLSADVYRGRVHSFTHNRDYEIVVGRDFLLPSDRLLILDDFLANGSALEGLLEVVDQSGASVAGAGIVIEKGFQEGGAKIRARGIRVESLAIIDSMDEKNGTICFRTTS